MIRPPSTTAMRSARMAVDSRWAMRIAVRFSSRTSRAASILRLGLEVEVGGGLVEDQHPGVGEEGPGQGDELALARGQGLAPFVHDGVETVGHALDDVGQAHPVDRLVDLLVGGLGSCEGDVVADGAREQERLLGNHAELAAQRVAW